ncbi:hypothetical protein LT493_28375 [Streptomyces tricolor]|nr:hypothetical protein [Streptomyces tricolor]
MICLSRFQRLALLAASTTVITGGVLLPGSAFAASAPQNATVAAAGVTAAPQWAKTTDTPSGISVQLPGKAEVEKSVEDGVHSRVYAVPTDYGAIAFAVEEVPGTDPDTPWDLKRTLKANVDAYNKDSKSAKNRIRSTDVRQSTTADGARELHADLVADDGTTGHVRFVDHGQYLVTVITLSVGGQEDLMDEDHQRVLDSVVVPDKDAGQAGRTPESTEAPRSV